MVVEIAELKDILNVFNGDCIEAHEIVCPERNEGFSFKRPKKKNLNYFYFFGLDAGRFYFEAYVNSQDYVNFFKSWFDPSNDLMNEVSRGIFNRTFDYLSEKYDLESINRQFITNVKHPESREVLEKKVGSLINAKDELVGRIKIYNDAEFRHFMGSTEGWEKGE